MEESNFDEADKEEILKILLAGQKLVKDFDRMAKKVEESESL